MKNAVISRRPGRPTKNGNDQGTPGLSREGIIDYACTLAQNESCTEISMVRLGRELGVAPSLIHYYVGSLDDLLSAVINRAFMERALSFPPLTGRWRQDLETLLKLSYEIQLRWKGVTSYIATHNKHRLFQRVREGENDYGLVFFDRMGKILQRGGFSQKQAALAYHLLMLFVLAVANADVNHQQPATHRKYIMEHLGQFSKTDYGGAAFLADAFTKIDTKTTFEQGLRLLLNGFERWLAPADL